METLPPASQEQQIVLQHLSEKKHIICTAVAGAGKSTTVMHIAKHFPHYRILAVTYNASLRLETREKCNALGINNLEVHTYHSFAVKYYDPACHTDVGMRHILQKNTPPDTRSGGIPLYDIIVIDECQDMTRLYFRFMVKVTRDMGTRANAVFDPFDPMFDDEGEAEDASLDDIDDMDSSSNTENEGGDGDRQEDTMDVVVSDIIGSDPETQRRDDEISPSGISADDFLLVIVGDPLQAIYDFKGSDQRFLTHADQLWSHAWYIHEQNPMRLPRAAQNGASTRDLVSDRRKHFVRTALRTSYRITRHMATFVNEVLVGQNLMEAVRDGPPILYLRKNIHTTSILIFKEIKRLLDDGIAQPSDFFILGNSNNASHVKNIEALLVEHNIPCYIPGSHDAGSPDERIAQGKVNFATFFTAKGRQRRFVFVLAFEKQQSDLYAKARPHYNPTDCMPSLYVACTRATEQMWICESDNNNSGEDGPPAFLKKNHLQIAKLPYVSFQGIPKPPQSITNFVEESSAAEKLKREYLTNLAVTDLISFIDEETYDLLLPILETAFVCEQPPNPQPIEINNIVQCTQGNFEDVSDINGIAIPLMYFDHLIWNHVQGISPTTPTIDDIQESQDVDEDEADATLGCKHDHNKGASAIFNLLLLEQQIFKASSPHKIENRGKIFQALNQLIQEHQQQESQQLSVETYLRFTNMYTAIRNKRFFKTQQIFKEDYKWLSTDTLAQCFAVLDAAISPEERARVRHWQIERKLVDANDDEIHEQVNHFIFSHGVQKKYKISGLVDLATHNTVYEFKCTSHLSPDHFLQLCLYAWLWRCICHYPPREFRLLNIRTGEKHRLVAEDHVLETIAIALFRKKEKKIIPAPLTQFLQIADI